MVKILIADDQSLIRDSLSIILTSNPDYDVIGCVSSGKEVLEFLEHDEPNIIFMDVRMPEMDGVMCTKIVKEAHPNIHVIVLTTFDDDEYIISCLKYGASGYLLKGDSPESLTNAITTVLSGGSIIDSKATMKMVKLLDGRASANITIKTHADVNDLSEREWNIIIKVAQGFSNKEIAQTLYFSEGTVRNYLSVILEKLQFRDRTQLAIWYLNTGFLICEDLGYSNES